ncbi:bifunctional 4-hydroxy-2-oxoglutarate aldolase/2-dehydro-3-deoxy-phosphogluconate aldolase [Rhodococcus sp. PSBB049]|uniref:bifunctional 4-hydroxy-2-oxoglutarate aldolase/2-dehydro-3-deoxy-phosphogluconate aldolase n=1 Tax=Rhodococcus sp. PSBB049 TaxID=2812863 RepID=UPI00197F79D9|nr:bifunctional 4-hydroxy-2-oxoglutarate aldolase/2-dehydro-3-deoxy-phosphogluconate aldolase [Rhodococcus sp. PSBB049]QSE72568.1 bifunctional 4-hydroxy-2-oxoglutarate aldolase/2-dehydro-3-deoxy-phosphogluconate aldolase [Rhodococcus sp. PSBB049]
MTTAGVLGKVIAVLRAANADRYHPVVDELIAGGIRNIELTLTTPGTLDVVHQLRAGVGDCARIGVGTVTTSTSAGDAIRAGAQFLVTPGVAVGPAELARQHNVPIMMGALTPTEIMAAIECEADLIKIFPASTVGADYLTQLRGPFPDLQAVPSGGVDSASARDWLAAGAVAVSIGGPLIGDALRGGSLRDLAARIRKLEQALKSGESC